MINFEDYGYAPVAQRNVEQKKKSNGWKDYISEAGGILGGLVGTAAGGVGAVGGATAGAAGGQWLENMLTGKKDSVAKEAIYSGVGEIAGLGLAKIGGMALKGAGKMISKGGEDLAVKGIRATPSQLTKFTEQHGEDITQVIRRNKLEGADSDFIEKTIKPLQDGFDDIVQSTKIKVDPAKLDQNFYSKVKTLLDSGDIEDIKVAERILEQYDYITKNTDYTLKSLNKLRKNFDLKYSQYKSSNPLVASEKQVIADALRGTVREGAEQAGFSGTKEMGQELGKLYDLLKIAAKQENRGRGSLPVGLSTLLGGAVGGATGGGAGAVAGSIAAEKVFNNPKTIGILSRLLTSAGEKVTNQGMKTVGKTGINIAGTIGQGAAQGIDSIGDQADDPDGMASLSEEEFQSSNTDLPNQVAQSTNKSTGRLLDDNDLKVLAIQDMVKTGGKNLSKIDFLQKMLKDETKEKKAPSAAQQKDISKAKSAIAALKRIEGANLGTKYNPLSQEGRLVNADIKSLKDIIGYFRTGAAISEEQSKAYNAMLPNAYDSAATRKKKADAIRAELLGYLNQEPDDVTSIIDQLSGGGN